MSKRIHQLAKEWNSSTKEVLECAERLGIAGKRAQSSLTDEEARRVQEALRRTLDPTTGLAIGKERVVDERLVTEREQGADQLSTVREKTTETRLRTNVIRRRVARQVVRRQDLPPPVASPAGDETAIPPPVDFGTSIPPPLPDEIPPALPPAAPPPPPGPPEVQEPASATGTAGAGQATDVGEEAPAPEEDRPAAGAAEEPRPAEAQPAEPAPTDEAASAAAGGAERPQGVKVLGTIDLRKVAPPPSTPSGGWRPGTDAAAPPPPFGVAPPPDAGRRRKGRRVVKKTDMADTMERDFRRGGKRPFKRRALPGKEVRRTEITVPRASKRVIRISEVITVADLAKSMGIKAGEVLKKVIDMGVMATINQALDHDTAALVASEFEYQVENVAFDVEQTLEAEQQEGVGGEQVLRAPVVTMMGHVDHGKTSLLDAIRATNVAGREAGGITQHIGAYTVDLDGKEVTFLDTPGHEAFTAMRARGAQATDIVVLVVAADDGVMPQTVEAINHARAAGVPIVVAINKIDKSNAAPERVMQELSNHGLQPEAWGGDTICVPVSATTREGIDQLLEMLLLQAEVLELRALPGRLAKGVIVEARLDRGRGPVATVLVQDGTLHVGDSFVCGTEFGRVRAMMDHTGARLKEAPPSTPVELLGLGGVPAAGDTLVVVQDEQKARQVAEHRRGKLRDADLSKTAKVSLDELYQQVQSGDVKELKVILKADVQGSIEALGDALGRLGTEEVRLTVIHGSVGGITESDVLLASASNAIIVGFNVRPEPKAAALAEREGVDIRLYSIIYEALEEIRDAMTGLLEPTLREQHVGRAEVRNTFSISGIGTIAGAYVVDGKIVRNAAARLVRDHVVVHTGKIGSLKRFKDDAREVTSGYECGIGFEGYSDVKVGDVIEVYEMVEEARTTGDRRTASAARPA
jgi:translation initiation factor IF-2